MAQKTISILGCGWLGLPLGARLARRGYRVKGSTTSPDKLPVLAEAGIEPYHLTLDPRVCGDRISDFFRADVLFLNVPPGRRRPDVETFFGAAIHFLIEELHYASVDFVVFASSTSVYASMNGVVYEVDAGKPKPWSRSGRALFDAERRLLADRHFDTTVLRFAGLYGYDRRPGRFLADRKTVDNGAAPVNLVHRDDAVAVVETVLEQDARHHIFNVCADAHPTRRAFYTRAAHWLGLRPPVFVDGKAASYKIVSNRKLKEHLDYRFLHPDPLIQAP
jgi:nucleoside-diphosphate-sugar epimerase